MATVFTQTYMRLEWRDKRGLGQPGQRPAFPRGTQAFPLVLGHLLPPLPQFQKVLPIQSAPTPHSLIPQVPLFFPERTFLKNKSLFLNIAPRSGSQCRPLTPGLAHSSAARDEGGGGGI